MNLLLVDDDKLDRMNTIRALKNSGYTIKVAEASTAEMGLEMAQAGDFDMILLDYQLPTMDGLELLKMLRESDNHRTAVTMLSHSEDENLAIQCIEAGAQDFLTKGEVTASRLIRAIMQAKERYRIEQELLTSREQLRQLAEIDTLTGLANRYMFEEKLKTALTTAKGQGVSVALMMLDLDKFKDVNDTLGHDAGDQLLQEVAGRLREPVRDGDLLCRLGGDEFAILIKNLEEISQIRKIASRILASLNKPLVINGYKIKISASIGVSTFPQCAADPIQLMKCADVAMYRSKEAGRNQFHFYSKAIHNRIRKRFDLERELYNAFEQTQFILHYQPQVEPETKKLLGVEALLRWKSPSQGLVSPLEFIPTLEENGLIKQVGSWVLETACSQLHQWRERYNAKDLGVSMAINLSAKQLDQKGLYEKIKHTLNRYQIPADYLELELTESALNTSSQATELLSKLSSLGIVLAMDDFGTGYSSLFQLQKYPFRVVKIDKSFIQTISGSDSDALFLKAIKAFAKVLDIEVVAEGVETTTQNRWCQRLKFDRVQGYHFAKPMTAKEFEREWLTTKTQASGVG